MKEPRFRPGDLVTVRVARSHKPAVWRVRRRDYWHTDTEPAYELRYGNSKDMHIRFAFDSDLDPVTTTNGSSDDTDNA